MVFCMHYLHPVTDTNSQSELKKQAVLGSLPCVLNGNHWPVYKKLEDTWTWFTDINELAFSFETGAWKTLFFLLDFSGDFNKWDLIIDFSGKRKLVN